MEVYKNNSGQFINADCLDAMKNIPDGSVDMVLCDLPYGTTACKWDSIIPFDLLWKEYWRISKQNAAIVLTASQPFTTSLIHSQIQYFKYEWIWSKNIPSNFASAHRRPMTSHENVCVFSKGKIIYNKQPTKTKIKDRKLGGVQKSGNSNRKGETYGGMNVNFSVDRIISENVSPRTVLEINCVPRSTGTIHPTQKPVALFEYLIRTYTNEGDTVLDNCAGSGTTAIAAINTNRKWICIEKDAEYSRLAVERIKTHHKPVDLFTQA